MGIERGKNREEKNREEEKIEKKEIIGEGREIARKRDCKEERLQGREKVGKKIK